MRKVVVPSKHAGTAPCRRPNDVSVVLDLMIHDPIELVSSSPRLRWCGWRRSWFAAPRARSPTSMLSRFSTTVWCQPDGQQDGSPRKIRSSAPTAGQPGGNRFPHRKPPYSCPAPYTNGVCDHAISLPQRPASIERVSTTLDRTLLCRAGHFLQCVRGALFGGGGGLRDSAR